MAYLFILSLIFLFVSSNTAIFCFNVSISSLVDVNKHTSLSKSVSLDFKVQVREAKSKFFCLLSLVNLFISASFCFPRAFRSLASF